MIQDIKRDLIHIIEETNDENLLRLMKDDFTFYGKTLKEKDIVDDLNEEQLAELELLNSEPEQIETLSHQAYQKATAKWRTK